MNIFFMGTPDFSVPSLELFVKNYNVLGVFTQPPRPSGRGMNKVKSPIHNFSERHDLNLFTPDSLKNKKYINILQKLKPDLVVVVAYGLIVPELILNIPKYGCINGHASLLPKWRGAAPIQRAIEAGEKKTGCTTMLMESGLDTGPMIYKKEVNIKKNDDVIDLYKKLSKITAECLDKTIKMLICGKINYQNQNNSVATYAHKLNKNEGLITWDLSAVQIHNKMRAFKYFPGTFFYYNQNKINIIDGIPIEKNHNEKPGTIITLSDKILIACNENTIFQINMLQKAGKNKMSVKDFLNGNNLKIGEKLD